MKSIQFFNETKKLSGWKLNQVLHVCMGEWGDLAVRMGQPEMPNYFHHILSLSHSLSLISSAV